MCPPCAGTYSCVRLNALVEPKVAWKEMILDGQKEGLAKL